MGLFKDWRDDHEGYAFTAKVRHFFSLGVWLRLHRWRRQRANRGWSDRDAWNTGDHIAELTAQMLKHMHVNGKVGWDSWFEMNINKSAKYGDLESVIADIEAYIEFGKTSWADGLEMVTVGYTPDRSKYTDGDRIFTDEELDSIIEAHSRESVKIYKKATEAMQFFGKHFGQFWD